MSLLMTLVVMILCSPNAAFSSGTNPPLGIDRVDFDYTKEDGILVRVEGTLPFDDLIDHPYPLQLFIRNKERFLCFSVPWGPMGGEMKELKDLKSGLTDEVVDRIGILAHPDPQARILTVGPRRMDVLLPRDFPTDDLVVQLFVIYRDAPIYSNPVSLKVHKEAW